MAALAVVAVVVDGKPNDDDVSRLANSDVDGCSDDVCAVVLGCVLLKRDRDVLFRRALLALVSTGEKSELLAAESEEL